MDMMALLTIMLGIGVTIIGMLTYLSSRYRRCPSDKILVVYGRVGPGKSSYCIHGGGAFVWPLVQESQYLSLAPLNVDISLENALSRQNIRVNVPSTFTVGVSTEEGIMNNAAERLLGLHNDEIIKLAREIIFGQLRQTVATLTIEQINGERDLFLDAIRNNVEPELNKVGLYLINVNITDITDESGYIQSLGMRAAADANNQAKLEVEFSNTEYRHARKQLLLENANDLKNIISQECEVYLTLRPIEPDQPEIVVRHPLQVVDWRTQKPAETLSTGERVRVVRADEDRLIVEKVLQLENIS